MRGLFAVSAALLACIGSVSAAPLPGTLKPSDFPTILSDLTVPSSPTNATSADATTSTPESSPFGEGLGAGAGSIGAKRAVTRFFKDVLHPRTVDVAESQVELPVEVRSVLEATATE